LLTLQLLAYSLIGALVILLPTAAPAQVYRQNDLFREADVDTASSVSYEFAPSAVALPSAPAPKKKAVIDKKFIAVMAGLGGAESVRIATHKLVLDHEFAAGAPWVTSVPPNSHVVFKFSGIYAAELLVAYELKKPHAWLPGDRVIRNLWWMYPAAMAPMHVANGIRSMHTQPPACAASECQ